MPDQGNAFWDAPTAVKTLFGAVVLTVCGLGIALGTKAHVAGGVVVALGMLLATVSYLTYRL